MLETRKLDNNPQR